MTRHLLATDVRRFRWVLIAWVLLTVGYAALAFATPGFIGDTARYYRLNGAVMLLLFVTFIAPLVLVPVVVQADSAVGSEVFWATRPIPPLALLAAKIALLSLALVALPAALDVAAMTAGRIAPGEIARVALETLLNSLAWLAVLMAASAITPSFARFALLCASAVVAFALNLILWETLLRSREAGQFAMVSVGYAPMSQSDEATRWLVSEVGLILAWLALLIVQYRRRQRLLSVPVGVAGVALVYLAAAWGPWPLRSDPPLPDWTSGVRLTAVSPAAPIDPPSAWGGSVSGWRVGRLSLRVGGVAPGWFTSVAMREASLTLPDGSVIDSRRGGFSASPAPEEINEAPQRTALKQLLSVNLLADRYPPLGENVMGMLIPEDGFRRLEPVTARYRGSFAVHLWRTDIAGTLPIQPGASFNSGVYQLTLRGLRAAAPGMVAFHAIESAATSTLDRGPHVMHAVYAVNPARSEAVEAVIFPVSGGGDFAGFGVHASIGVGPGFRRHAVVITFSTQQGSNRVEMPLDEAWVKNAHLVVVRTARIGEVVRGVEVQGLKMCTPQNGGC